jgi:hypothetical protein
VKYRTGVSYKLDNDKVIVASVRHCLFCTYPC